VEEVVELGYLAVLAEELDEGVFIESLCEIAYEEALVGCSHVVCTVVGVMSGKWVGGKERCG